MRIFIKIFLIILVNFNCISAQSRSDFELRVENSFQKLYEDPDIAIHAAKEVRNDGGGWLTKDILTRAYLLKGDYLSSVRDAFEKSKLENTNQELLSKLIIAREFYFHNLYDQTSKILEPILLDKEITHKSVDHAVYAKLFQLEARNLIALKKLDEAEKSLLKSSDFAKNNKNSFTLILKENQFLKATIALEKGNSAEALKQADQLLKDLGTLPRAKYLFAITQQFRGQLFFENQQYDQSIACLKSALNAIDKTNYIPLKSSIYEDLAKSYLVIKNNEEFEHYKNKHEEISKTLEESTKEARLELIKLNTESTSENNAQFLQKKKTNLLFLAGISIGVLFILGLLFFREIQKSKMLNKQIRFFKSMQVQQSSILPKEKLNTETSQKKQLFIPKETEEEILEGLQQFENSEKYLDNNMSLATLAVELNTNTKYLSEIINRYKDKNFNAYINELRVKHVIQLLSTDRSYLQYKISYIAEIGGFTSHSAFTNIFKSVTGMSPNEYIQTLRQET